jgi:hypothetical protein
MQLFPPSCYALSEISLRVRNLVEEKKMPFCVQRFFGYSNPGSHRMLKAESNFNYGAP